VQDRPESVVCQALSAEAPGEIRILKDFSRNEMSDPNLSEAYLPKSEVLINGYIYTQIDSKSY
jgi:hypothetical protein